MTTSTQKGFKKVLKTLDMTLFSICAIIGMLLALPLDGLGLCDSHPNWNLGNADHWRSAPAGF